MNKYIGLFWSRIMQGSVPLFLFSVGVEPERAWFREITESIQEFSWFYF